MCTLYPRLCTPYLPPMYSISPSLLHIPPPGPRGYCMIDCTGTLIVLVVNTFSSNNTLINSFLYFYTLISLYIYPIYPPPRTGRQASTIICPSHILLIFFSSHLLLSFYCLSLTGYNPNSKVWLLQHILRWLG